MFQESNLIKISKGFNNFYFKMVKKLEGYCPLIVDNFIVGLVDDKIANYFNCLTKSNEQYHFKQQFNNYQTRSNAIANNLNTIRNKNIFTTLNGWRNECFEIKSGGGYSGSLTDSKSLFEMERSATCLFGIRQFGVDINGYVMHPQKGLCIWLQKRAENKQTWPGKMDNMVGGGLSVGYSVLETALKEASEEAGISKSLLESLVPCGAVSFYFQSERGLFPNTEFVFDLELPLDFIPINQDGEVQSFTLLTAKEVMDCVVSVDFKTTSCPVTLDFLIRHGVININNEPQLSLLLELLHVPLTTLYNNI